MIKTIYHLADIHITNNESRHEEYEQVFNNLYKILEADSDNKLIVIVGDLFHEKNSHQNKQNILAKQFINKLSSYGQIVIIDGNHDYVPVNENSSSSIDSLLRYLEIKNPVHYLTENKIYNICGINFGLTTMISSKITKPNKKVGEIYIGLYHGTLYKSTTNLGWTNDNESNFKVGDFADYDIVMLGDIHKFQFLNKAKTIAYPSSLIQQNFGESIDSHGLIKWNLDTKVGQFIPVDNKWVYKVHEITDIKNYFISDIENKSTRLKLIYKNIKREDIDNYKKQIQKKYNIINIRQEEQYEVKQSLSNNSTINTKGLLNIYSSYISEHKLKLDIDVKNKLIEYNENLGLDLQTTIKNLKLKKLEFSNLFAYGTNNKIDFESMEGINIIIGTNGLGKSSIVDVILFTLFKKFSRGTGNDALNIRYDKGFGKLTVDLNGEIYQITRSLHLNKEDVKMTKNNIDITCSSKLETDNEIKKIFGNYEDMIMTSIILQVGQNFIDLAETERQNTLTKVLRLDMYDQILSSVKSELSNLSKNTLVKYEKSITKIDYKSVINELKEEIVEYQEYLLSVEDELNELLIEELTISNSMNKDILNLDKNNLIQEINLLKQEIKIKTNELEHYQIDNSINLQNEKEKIKNSIDKTNEEIKSIFKNVKYVKKPNLINVPIEKINLQIENYEKRYNQLINLKLLLTKKYSTNSLEEIKLQIQKTEEIISKITSNLQEKNKKLQILEIIKTKSKFLLEHKFNLKCDSCIYNKKLHNSHGYLSEIENLQVEITSIELEDETNYKTKLTELNQLIDVIKELELVKSNIELWENKKNIQLNNAKLLEEYEILQKNNLIYEQEIESKENLVVQLNLQYKRILSYEKTLLIKSDFEIKLINKQKMLDEYLNCGEEIVRYNQIIQDKKNIILIVNEYKNKIYELNIKLSLTVKEYEEQNVLLKEYEVITKKYDTLNKVKGLFISGFKEYAFKNRTEILESRINNITRNLANYEIKIHIDNGIIKFYKLIISQKNNSEPKSKTKLKNQLDVSDGNLYLNISECSGFERTAFNIGLRLALNSMNITNKNNFLIIDEHFSSADNNNINNVIYLFDTIKTQYEFCIIISHLNEIKNINENKIYIERDINTGNSKIFYE